MLTKLDASRHLQTVVDNTNINDLVILQNQGTPKDALINAMCVKLFASLKERINQDEQAKKLGQCSRNFTTTVLNIARAWADTQQVGPS
ncbi:hypothetical protein COB11_04495 [Candidatus Aerophobetes bacterium]|uniref:Uncharacterized protein n=1 Tax=Aerophobetes bacterium TaxID=2030807 RepID=A0A2A4YGK0_UNCAE|nr:MAG: hypothetical protein COB11_04495 [Candidatus Aerophobetes bacterium]